jgi:hypothetical protein
VEYARRLAQRGTPLTALLRAYRVGHACFSGWLLREPARQAGDAEMISATTLGMSKIVAGYIDQTSEAEESIGRPVGEKRNDVELALRASKWLGSFVLQPTMIAGRVCTDRNW